MEKLNEAAEMLCADFLAAHPTQLSVAQLEKFKQACKKTVNENPSLSMPELFIAARIYLNLIQDFPELEL